MARDLLRERRGPLKAVHLWLPFVLAAATDHGADPWRSAIAALQLLAAAACFAQVSILVNDRCDENADRAAGKSRWIHSLTRRGQVALIGALAVLGAAALVPGASTWRPVAVYGGAVLLGCLYSAPPCRLKGRGALGPFAYSLSTTLAFAVTPWSWFRASWIILAAVGPAVFLDKWVNLHWHQMGDLESDRDSGVRTFAVRLGRERATRSLRAMAVFASLAMAALWAFAAWRHKPGGAVAAGVTAATALLAGLHARSLRRRDGPVASMARALPWAYLGASFATFRALPLVLLAWLAAEATPWLAPLAVASLMVTLEARSSLRAARNE